MSNAFFSNLFVNEALRLLGRWARWALPAGVVIGLIFPVLADRMQWLVTPSVIGTLTASLLRLDWQRLADFLRRPGLALRIAAIQLVLAPLAVYGLARAGLIPEAFTVITVLQAAASPIGSAAAFAMFIGLSGNLSMAAAVLMTLLLPLTLTGVVSLLLPIYGSDVDVLRFFVRVALTSLTPFLLAAVIRRLAGLPRLQRWDGELAGINVLLLVVFAIAIMAGVTETFLAQPDYMLGMLAWAWLAAVFWHATGYLLFLRKGTEVALNAAILFGNRNMGLTLVVTAGTAGEAFQMYAGLAQIPMYCAPLLLSPLARRLR